MTGPAVALRDVRKRYPGGQDALRGVSFEVLPGQVFVLLGTSGSGKTTALKTINGLVPTDAGSVLALGEDVAAADLIRLRRRIGYVIQEAGLFPHLSVAENVGLVPELLGWDGAKRRERVREMLALVRLDADRFAPLRPAQLSGGERQRVGIARALAADPPLVLMDEPFGALDPLTRRHIQRDFRELQQALGKTVVLVTHDVPEAFRLADRLAVMHDGQVVQEGSPSEVREAPEPGFVKPFLEAAFV